MSSFRKHFHLILLLFVIAVAILFRFWQIRDYVVFLGDEGRDMIVMRNIFIEKNLPFLGPTASVGGFYLGPIYYWMAAPFLFLWRFDPAGPSYFVAILGVATVYLLYRFLKEAVGFWPAILTSFLYAVAPLIVRYSRSSWNPNPLPFFALLMIYLIYKGIKDNKAWYFLGAGASFGIAIQLHYLGLNLAIISALIILANEKLKRLAKVLILLIMGSILTFSPFLIFEIRHNFPNFKTISEFVTRGTTIGYEQLNLLALTSSTGNMLIEEISSYRGMILTKLLFWILFLSGVWALVKYWPDKKIRLFILIALIWFIGGLLSLRLYIGQIYDYYFGFMFPAPFVLAGSLIFAVWKNKFFKLASLLTVFLIAYAFLNRGFYITEPNRLIDQTETIADFVIDKSQGKPYNFALISESNSNHAYRYFLEIKGFKPVELETIVTDQLIVICESKKCEPLGNPAWEIAGFGRGEIAQEQDLEYGIKIFRLIHWSGEPSPAGKPAVKEG